MSNYNSYEEEYEEGEGIYEEDEDLDEGEYYDDEDEYADDDYEDEEIDEGSYEDDDEEDYGDLLNNSNTGYDDEFFEDNDEDFDLPDSLEDDEDDDDFIMPDSPDESSESEEDLSTGEGVFFPAPQSGDGLGAEDYRVVKESKDPDASLARAIEIDKGSFSLRMGTISISDLVIPTMVKDSRRETYLGLSRSVEELGVLVPVHVMLAEGYAEHIDEGGSEEDYDGPKYVLLDGLRRVFALQKNGLGRVNAIIYDFNDRDKGSDMVNILSMILNKVQRRSWGEIWYMYQVLEESESVLTPGNIEYLLQLEPGDAMKLKEIMTRRNEFPEPAEDLLDKKKNLQQAYNMLIKAMREQDQLAKEDVSGVSDMDETEGVIDSNGSSDGGKLSDQEVKEILDMEDKFDGELSDDDFDELMGNNLPDERQTVGERHPLDPALRAAVLQRDGYCCQVTGRGKGLPTPIALSILNVHHIVPVSDGGLNSMNNLITVEIGVHTLIHVIQRNGGKLGMSREQYDSLSEEEQKMITGVMKLARMAVEADRRTGKTREQVRQNTSDSIRFQMPGKIQKENMDALAKAKVKEG